MDERKLHFKVIQFMMEAGTKLRLKSVPVATACVIYHKFFHSCNVEDYDPYLIASGCLYLAGKVEEDHLKLHDVINVSYRCLHPDKPPLDIGTTYWQLRESLAQCELFILRVLKFEATINHPHKYLLHYIKSLLDWLDPETAEKVPIANTAWALLRDSYHGKISLKYPPHKVAVAILYMTLQCYGVEVPYNQEAEEKWYEALAEDISLPEIRKIISELINTYNLENTVI